MSKFTSLKCLILLSVLSFSNITFAQTLTPEGGSHTGIASSVVKSAPSTMACEQMKSLLETIKMQLNESASQKCLNDANNKSFDCKKFQLNTQQSYQAVQQAQQILQQSCNTEMQQPIQD